MHKIIERREKMLAPIPLLKLFKKKGLRRKSDAELRRETIRKVVDAGLMSMTGIGREILDLSRQRVHQLYHNTLTKGPR